MLIYLINKSLDRHINTKVNYFEACTFEHHSNQIFTNVMKISGNRSNGSGAGVILDGNGSFIMTGGKITGNTANFSDQEKYSDSTGAGVYVCAKKLANFSVGGSAQITGRVCVIGSHLAEDALKELFHIG